jgi:hypothetical protein
MCIECLKNAPTGIPDLRLCALSQNTLSFQWGDTINHLRRETPTETLGVTGYWGCMKVIP